MKKLELKLRKSLRILFGSLSLTAVAFIFQACYGVLEDEFYDVKLTGTVMSKTTHLPIKGIKVAINDDDQYNFGITDENGKFDFYASIPEFDYYGKDNVYYRPDSVRVHFLDIDSIKNGYFADTTIFINPAHKDEVKINMEMTEKQ